MTAKTSTNLGSFLLIALLAGAGALFAVSPDLPDTGSGERGRQIGIQVHTSHNADEASASILVGGSRGGSFTGRTALTRTRYTTKRGDIVVTANRTPNTKGSTIYLRVVVQPGNIVRDVEGHDNVTCTISE